MINMNLKVTSTTRNVSFSQHLPSFHPVDVKHQGAPPPNPDLLLLVVRSLLLLLRSILPLMDL